MACVQAMAVFGFAGILGSLILLMAYLLGNKNGDYILLAAFICIITGNLSDSAIYNATFLFICFYYFM